MSGKKIVIIGAGIGGLSAAVYAAKQGFDTEVYERHSIVGGECTGWDRQGYHIDNCIHWMMGSNPGTGLNKLWRETGALSDDIPMRRADRMYTSELNGQRLSLWSDADRTEQEMIALSPADEKEIRKLMKFCRMAQKTEIPSAIPSELMSAKDGLKMAMSMKDTLKLFKEYQGQNVQDLCDKFQHPLIRCLISDFTPLDTQASSFPMAYGNFISGDGGVPAGGSRAMAQRMRERAEGLGCRFFCNSEVERIKIEGEQAVGVVLADGSEVAADYIIPAVDASVTFGHLLPESYMEPLMRDMYADRAAYPVYNTFQVALAVDGDEDALGAEIVLDCPELILIPGQGQRITVKSYNYEPSFAPAGKQIVQTLQGGHEDLYEFWTTLYQDKAAYEAKKRGMAEQTRAVLEQRFPAWQGKLSVLDAWTPMTYARYCRAYKGFYQSFMISKDSAKLPYPSAYIKGLGNVVLAGQWISPPGGLPGAAITGKFAIQRICKLDGKNHIF